VNKNAPKPTPPKKSEMGIRNSNIVSLVHSA